MSTTVVSREQLPPSTVTLGQVRNGRRANTGEPVDLFVTDGRFTSESGANPRPAGATLDLDGTVVLPGFVEPHVHLDKAFLTDRLRAGGAAQADLHEAITATAALRATFTREDLAARAQRLLEQLAAHGVTAARVHVEVEPILGLLGVEVHLELREAWAAIMEIELVAFPQNGLQSAPGTDELLDEAMRLGCDVVGGCPYIDPDQAAHLDTVFTIADRWAAPIDLHVDFTDDPASRGVDLVTERTMAAGLGGRVAVGHVTSLAAVDRDTAARRADALAEARIHLVSLPQTDLFLGGRSGPQERPGSLAPLRLLCERGVNVCLGSNNVQNAFTPLGRPAPLSMAWLAGLAGHMSSPTEVSALLDMVTKNPARLLGHKRWDLTSGAPADLVVLDAEESDDLIATDPPVLGAMHRGRFREAPGPRRHPRIEDRPRRLGGNPPVEELNR